MMQFSEWVTFLGTVLGILTVGASAVAKLTHLVDAVEHLAETLKHIAETVEDHEKRLRSVERPGHAAPWDRQP